MAVAPQELQVRLAALAQQGAGITSIFTDMADKAGLTEKGREAKEREYERSYEVARAMMVSQERMAEFQKKLDRMERESYERMIKAEEELREARKEQERIRENAFEVDMPDGRKKVKVYRDGDQVREEDGTLVSPEIIRAEDLPKNCSTTKDLLSAGEHVESRERNYTDAASDFARAGEAKEALQEGTMTLDELEAIVEPMDRELEDARGPEEQNVKPQHQSVSTPGPG
jgi:hypothetical protein